MAHRTGIAAAGVGAAGIADSCVSDGIIVVLLEFKSLFIAIGLSTFVLHILLLYLQSSKAFLQIFLFLL